MTNKCIPNYYQDRVCLNVLANSIENAKEVYEQHKLML